jgi:hypothetical protein
LVWVDDNLLDIRVPVIANILYRSPVIGIDLLAHGEDTYRVYFRIFQDFGGHFSRTSAQGFQLLTVGAGR